MPEPGITLKKMFFDGDYTGVIIHAFPSKTRPKTKKLNGKKQILRLLICNNAKWWWWVKEKKNKLE